MRNAGYANRPTATPEALPTGQNIQEKARWLMLEREKAARNRNDSMLHRSAQFRRSSLDFFKPSTQKKK